MRVYLSFTIALAVATAAVRRNDGYWNVQDPDQLYGPLRVEPFAALGFACKRTAVRLTRATATKEGLADAGACLDALQGSSGAKLGPEYFDVVPLLEVRALQYHAYGGYAVDGLMERLRAVRNRMDPSAARPAEAQETIDAAVASYSLGARSGRTTVRTFSGPRNDPEKCPGQVRQPNASASLHVHHHMTFHGGTTLVGILKQRTCALASNACAAQGALPPTTKAWTAAKDLPVSERRARVEAAILNITALAAYDGTPYAGIRGFCGRPGNAPRDWKASMDGNDPIDYVFYEPQLPPGAPVGQSRRILWTTTVRHPAKFSLSKILKSPRPMDRTIGPDFMVDMVLGSNPTKQRVRNSAYCESAPLRRSALPMLRILCGNRPGPGNLRDFGRPDLRAAKKRLSGFAVVMLLEHYAEGLLAFCRRLGWPNASCRIKEAPRSHVGAPSALKAAASQTSFRRRLQVDAPIRPRAGARGRPGVVRAPPRARGRAQGKAIPRISSHGLGAFMTAMNVTVDAFADVIDETQLSLELYFYARELNRADHMLLGLAPPGVGLLPPGEADVFAGRA